MDASFNALDVAEWRSAEMWLVSYVNCAQVSLTWWSIFLFLDVPTLKLRIIIILLTDWPNITLPTACTTKN